MNNSYPKKWRAILLTLSMMFLASMTLMSVGAAPTADTVTISQFPKDLQLFPRDTSTNKATITVMGTIVSTSINDVRVDVKREGVAYDSVTQSLSYSGGSADFSVDVTIDAELANYAIELYTVDGGTSAMQASADNIVAGDVYVIQGQSNAVAGMYTTDDDGDATNNPTVFSSASANNSFVRSYSTSSGEVAVLENDTNWYVADGDSFNQAGTIGQWGLQMADAVVDSHNIPLAVINGAFGGEEISFFQRDDAAPMDLTTNYGRLLHRMTDAGVKNDIRGIFWYQGESDEGNVEQHLTGFDAIYNDWKSDYPGVENVYVFQIADFCFDDNLNLREAQRRLPESYSDVTVLSTNAVKGHRTDCHYWWQDGYEVLGTQAAATVSRDYYGAPDTAVSAPDIERAYFSNADRTEVTIKLKNVEDGFNFDDFRSTSGNTALYRIGIYSDIETEYVGKELSAIDTVNGEIVFDVQIGWDTAPIPPVGNLTVTFEGDPWVKMGSAEADEDNITNNNGVGLLTFNAKVFTSATAPEAKINIPGDTQGVIGSNGFDVDFKGNLSSDPNQASETLQYLWDFGDGNSDTSTNKYYTYQNPGTYHVTLTVTDNDGNSDIATSTILVFANTENACTQHGLNYERFDNVSGTTIADLVAGVDFNAPSSHSYINDFAIPSNVADEYGARVRGFIVAPISGEYEFWVASDDESKVWLYTLNAAGSGFVAPSLTSTLAITPQVYVEGFSSPELQFANSDSPWNGRQWTAGVEFDAYDIFTKTLTVGEKYYVEGLFKEGSSGDHMSLGWKLPGADNYSLIKNTNLCVATTSLPLAPLPVIDAVKNGGGEPAGEAPLIILFDADDSTDDDGTIVNTVWSFGDGNVNNSNTQATAHEYKTPGTYYTVLSVTDNDGFTNHAVEEIVVAEPDCSAEGNGILYERFDNAGGRLIGDLLTSENYPDLPSQTYRLNTLEIPTDIGDEYGVRLRGYIVPDQSGDFRFRIASDDQSVMLLSTDENPANAAPIAAVTSYTGTLTFDSVTGIDGDEGWSPVRDFLNATTKYPVQESAAISMVSGQRYYVEVLYKDDFYGDHMSIGWQEPGNTTYDLVLCENLEPFTNAVHNLDITVEASRETVPTSGALVEYKVNLKNSSSAETAADPIQIVSIVDSLHGTVASTDPAWNAPFPEDTCYWWMPEMWVDQEWQCTYAQTVIGAGEIFTVTVTGQTASGTTIVEDFLVEYVGDNGPGTRGTDAWAADGIEVIEQYTQMVDTDGDMDLSFDPYAADIRDTEGILIGDYDLDGVCDMWQTWWLRNCIALSTSEVMAVLDDTSSTDMRDKMLRSLTGSWLNIIAGNEYACSDMETSVNLALIWLDDYGNPLDGGAAISSGSYTWTQIEYAQVWFEWFNSTGGNACAGQDTGSTTCGGSAQEAELAGTTPGSDIRGNRMKIVTGDNAASNDGYLHTPNWKGSKWSPSNSHYTEYCVTVAQDGYYSIDTHVRTPKYGSDNSFFVRFNNGGYALWDTNTSKHTFVPSTVTHRSWGGSTVYWYLTAGEHSLRFYLRENGTQLDDFALQLYTARNLNQDAVMDAGTPVIPAVDNGSGTPPESAHYFWAWLEDGNNVAGARTAHSGEFATAMAGFLDDVDGMTEQTEVVVSGAVGWIEGSVEVATGTDDIVHVAGRTNFAPEEQVAPTAISLTNGTTASPTVWQMVAILVVAAVFCTAIMRRRTQ